MRVLELGEKAESRIIRFDRIKPFKNICKVTGVEEFCNVVTEYKVGGGKVLDICDYRKFFERTFNELIEDIAKKVYKEIMTSAEPEWLRVTVYLEGNEHLTDWSCTIDSRENG